MQKKVSASHQANRTPEIPKWQLRGAPITSTIVSNHPVTVYYVCIVSESLGCDMTACMSLHELEIKPSVGEHVLTAGNRRPTSAVFPDCDFHFIRVCFEPHTRCAIEWTNYVPQTTCISLG
jgi:hypothetical protein